MAEFTVNGQSYRTAKIDAMRQFHLSRKIAPIIPALIPVFAKLAESQKAEDAKPLSSDLATMAHLFEPFAEAIAHPTTLAEQIARKLELIANATYSGCNGKGPVQSCDGWRYRRAYHKTTHSFHRFYRHPNLLKPGPRQVLPGAPERVWVSDITYLPSSVGPLYLSLVSEACSRRIVGHLVHEGLHAESAARAFSQALQQRRTQHGK